MNMQTAKRLALGASLSLAVLCTQGQNSTFDVVHYNVAGGACLGSSVREISSGYLVFGVQTQLDLIATDCTTGHYTPNGQFSSETYIHRPRFQDFGGSSDPISSIPEGTGFLGAWNTFLGSELVDTIWAVRFNEFGDTLWTKPILSDTFAFARKAVAKNDQYYFTGQKAANGQSTANGYVMRTDTLANIELLQLHLPIDPNTMDVDYEGNMYVAGLRNYKGYFLKVDSSGNEVWNRFQPKPQGNWYGVKHMFGDKLLCMGKWTAYYQPLPDTSTMYLCMYDESGDLEWQFQGLKNKGNQNLAMFTDGYQDSDSTFIVCGAIQQLYWNRALIYRFNAAGTPLWRRDYAHFSNLTTLYPEIPWDIEPTNDGGMVLTGEAWNHDTIPPFSDQNMWLMKLDSMGCLVPGCQYVGINEVAYGLGNAMKVWPNPSDGRISLALDLPEGLPLEGGLLLQVFDARGRQVLRKNIGSQLAQTIALDLSGESAGLYSAHISDNRRILTGARLILR